MVGAVIVAAGSGRRMKSMTPKQYLPLNGLPVLAHTLRRISASRRVTAIALVVPPDDHDYCRRHILPAADITTPVQLVNGGPRRQDSVDNGLSALGDGADDDIIVIHDGVRPLVRSEDIDACIEVAHCTGACIVGRPVTDTLKAVAAGQKIISTIERHTVWRAQTPQVFRRAIILAAHREAARHDRPATDDSALVEAIGIPVSVIPAGRFNIKITMPEDLHLAAALLKMATDDENVHHH